MHILAIIPARGGSKGIPRKNIKPLAGLPLIAHSVIAAQNSNLITRLVISTEDTEIAECAATYNCEVPFIRPAHLADDSSRDLEVFLHCLSWLKDNESYSPDIVVHLRPTAPLRTAAHQHCFRIRFRTRSMQEIGKAMYEAQNQNTEETSPPPPETSEDDADVIDVEFEETA